MATVLIIDDSAFQRSFLRRTVAGAGWRAIPVASGEDALEELETRRPDLILTDLIMPDMRGLALLETLQERRLEIPIVVLTADIQEPIRERCLELGAARVLYKPIKPDELVAAIEELLPPESPPQGSPEGGA